LFYFFPLLLLLLLSFVRKEPFLLFFFYFHHTSHNHPLSYYLAIPHARTDNSFLPTIPRSHSIIGPHPRSLS
jgi:hypothetical protein